MDWRGLCGYPAIIAVASGIVATMTMTWVVRTARQARWKGA